MSVIFIKLLIVLSAIELNTLKSFKIISKCQNNGRQ